MAAPVLRFAAVAALVSVSAASNSTAHEVNITVDGEAVPFHWCFITGASLRNLGSDQSDQRASPAELQN